MGCWTGLGRRHADLERSITSLQRSIGGWSGVSVSHPTRCRASANSGGGPEPPRFLTRASTTSQSAFLATHGVVFVGPSCSFFPLIGWFFLDALPSLAPSIFSHALASPAATPPHPLSDTAGFRPSPLLSPLLSLLSFHFCRPPAVFSSFLPRT